MKIQWSPLAIERVTEIAEYIALDNPMAADKWVNDIFDSTEILSDFSKIGRVVPELQDQTMREILKNNYRILYKIEINTISILTVRHGRQILPIEELKVE